MIEASIKFVFGTTSSITGSVTFTLPNTANTSFIGQYIGQTRFLDASFGYFSGTVQQGSGTIGEILATRVDGTYATDSLLAATVPMTWVNTDTMWINLIYQRPTS